MHCSKQTETLSLTHHQHFFARDSATAADHATSSPVRPPHFFAALHPRLPGASAAAPAVACPPADTQRTRLPYYIPAPLLSPPARLLSVAGHQHTAHVQRLQSTHCGPTTHDFKLSSSTSTAATTPSSVQNSTVRPSAASLSYKFFHSISHGVKSCAVAALPLPPLASVSRSTAFVFSGAALAARA